MSDIFIPDLVEETGQGIFARHPSRFSLPVLTAPTTIDRGNASNLVRQHLVTVACANLKDYDFAFDSSVLEPRSAEGFTSLARLVALFPGCPLSIFGHTDPDGRAEYNKFLSERRARAVFGLLLRRTAVWEQLFSDKAEQSRVAGDVWGARAIQTMLTALDSPVEVDGKDGPATRAAFARFLSTRGGGSGESTPASRAVLFKAYMDLLAGTLPADPPRPFELQPSDFLAGARAPLGAPGDLQGCSEFNPQLILAGAELREFAAAGKAGDELRHAANEPNRRVVIYLYAKGSVKPENWPCPAARQGIAGCLARFWSDGKGRSTVSFEQHRRRFGKIVPEGKRELRPPNPALAARLGDEETTFGCRFYHGVALHSPCERDLKMWVLRLEAGGAEAPLGNVRWVARVGSDADAPVLRSTTTPKGTIGLPLFDEQVLIALRIDVGPVLLSGLGPPVTTIDARVTKDPVKDDPRLEAPAPAAPGGGNPLAGEQGTTAKTADPQAFPNEETFMTIDLDAGVLSRLVGPPAPDPNASDFDAVDIPPLTDAERRQGAAQRLRNLAFGGRDLLTDDAAFAAAVREFQLGFRTLDRADGVLDAETEDQLARRYGDRALTQVTPR